MLRCWWWWWWWFAENAGSSKQAGVHIDTNGQCVDLPLLDKALELLTVHLKVANLSELMLDTSDKRVAKYQKKWKERGMEWVECFTRIQTYFKKQQQDQVDDKTLVTHPHLTSPHLTSLQTPHLSLHTYITYDVVG